MGGFPWFEGDGSDCGLMFRFQDELWLKVSGWSDEATGVVEEEDEQSVLASGLGNYVDALVRRHDIALLFSSR
ncbi:hypothetical protein CASFOL_008732 [Castilleja foliolosa]|uniref:Uncharacterized protein n=1 Tax=Castilleja foliolosa TaxID=1961234 RepID=A0ABD3E3V8_9LAMI